jgi:hydrogenase nickel incorporation protein HypB
MAEAAGCDLDALRGNIQRVRPGMRVFEVSSKSGAGMDEWLRFAGARAAERGAHALP